jgi:hypothetical protein
LQIWKRSTMQINNLISALIGSLIGVSLTCIVKYADWVHLNRNLRLMLSREMEENRYLLSNAYSQSELIVRAGLRPHSFRLKMWEATMAQAPNFLSEKEISEVEVFYRKIKELQELNDYLKNPPNNDLTSSMVSLMEEMGNALGKSFPCIGKQRLNFFNYYPVVVWNQQGNSIGELQYHFTYPPSVIIGKPSLLQRFKNRVKKIIIDRK